MTKLNYKLEKATNTHIKDDISFIHTLHWYNYKLEIAIHAHIKDKFSYTHNEIIASAMVFVYCYEILHQRRKLVKGYP